MKKNLIALTALTLVLVACGKDDDKRPAESAATTAQPAAPAAPGASAPEAATVAGADAATSAPARRGARARATSQPAAVGATHTVARGDTLGAIGRRHGVSAAELAEWNDVRDPRRLRVGQELRLTPP